MLPVIITIQQVRYTTFKSVGRQISMDNVAHVLDGYELCFILIFAILVLWLIQL